MTNCCVTHVCELWAGDCPLGLWTTARAEEALTGVSDFREMTVTGSDFIVLRL